MLTLVNGKHMFRHRHQHRHRQQHQDQCQHQHRHQLTDIASGTGIVTSPRGLCSWSGFVYTTCRKLNTVTDHRQTHKQRTQTTKSANIKREPVKLREYSLHTRTHYSSTHTHSHSPNSFSALPLLSSTQFFTTLLAMHCAGCQRTQAAYSVSTNRCILLALFCFAVSFEAQ